jgi:BTB/POZ domain-containing protein
MTTMPPPPPPQAAATDEKLGSFRKVHFLRSVRGHSIFPGAKLTRGRALQSERIQVLVGESKKDFQVPKDLLAKCSPVFNAMCNSSFKESIEGVIELPEDNPLTFANFMVWLHTCPPAKVMENDMHPIIDLAVFADAYQVYSLKNQTSDLIQKCLLKKVPPITPAIMTQIYELTPDRSVLQELFCLGFVTYNKVRLSPETLTEWENVFEQLPTFGRDFFRITLQMQRNEIALSSTGTCRFHDHENMPGFDRASAVRSACPYPAGGDWIENEREEAKRKREQESFKPEKKGRKTTQDGQVEEEGSVEAPVELL